MTTTTQTTTVTYKGDCRHPLTGQPMRDSREFFLGRRAVFTTYEGTDLIGTITRFDGLYPVVTFPDGRWARLDSTVRLVGSC